MGAARTDSWKRARASSWTSVRVAPRTVVAPGSPRRPPGRPGPQPRLLDQEGAGGRRPVLSDSYGPSVAEPLGRDFAVRDLWTAGTDAGRVEGGEPDLVIAFSLAGAGARVG